MTHHTLLDDRLGGSGNFLAWKYMISLILEENDLDQYISKEVLEPEGDEDKAIHKNKLVKSNIIITESEVRRKTHWPRICECTLSLHGSTFHDCLFHIQRRFVGFKYVPCSLYVNAKYI